MIHIPIAAYCAAAQQNKKRRSSIPKFLMPIFETIDEARKSLIAEKGNHEFAIKESPVAIDLFVVCWVEDNNLYQYQYRKKITSYRQTGGDEQ